MKTLLRKILLRDPKVGEPESWVPAGHFYSPFPDIEDVRKRQHHIYKNSKDLNGIDLRESVQYSWLEMMESLYRDCPYFQSETRNLRYQFPNSQFVPADAYSLYSMIRVLKPNIVIEAGSGFSSSVILDIVETSKLETRVSFIEPYPETLRRTALENDLQRHRLYEKNIQDIEPNFFDQLDRNDILFIDSTHVSKFGSDVNYIIFNILPRLKSGVYVHFHDINHDFDYPFEWIEEGRGWNESYLLRAFLMYNSTFGIEYFNSYMGTVNGDRIREKMPDVIRDNNSGCSIWLSKL